VEENSTLPLKLVVREEWAKTMFVSCTVNLMIYVNVVVFGQFCSPLYQHSNVAKTYVDFIQCENVVCYGFTLFGLAVD